MQPLLFPGNRILVNRLDKGDKNDTIIIKNPNKKTLQLYFVKNIKKKEKNKVYVVGLNISESIDSRHFGWIDEKNIIGKMILKL